MFQTPGFILLMAASVSTLFAQTADVPPYQWSATGPLQIARQGACAAALGDGRILVAGGQGFTDALQSVEVYQSDGSFAPAADMLRARSGHTCTALADGRIFVAGGLGDGADVQAETFDPATNTWTPAEFGTLRWNHTATLLPDGRVLLAGGETADGPSNLMEWFDPQSNRIRSLPGTLSAARTQHAAALLPDGSVLVAGGWDGQTLLDTVELVKLDGTVGSTDALPVARAGHTASALGNGCILIAGGLGVNGDLPSASLYCIDSGTFRAAGDMSVARYGHLAVVLPNNGRVLIAGGFSQGEATAISELYDPEANTFAPAGSLTLARLGIAAAADPTSGAVLAVGGVTADGPVTACGILRSASVVFDKVRYLDGDSITVTGLGWAAGEKVNLSLSTQPFSSGFTTQVGLNQSFQTVASALGRIQQTLLTATSQGAGSTFRITATGVSSGLTASNTAKQISRTNMTLGVSPSPALTRQPVTLRASVLPVTRLDSLDGSVAFQTSSIPLGSVSSSGPVINVNSIGQITDGSSNTIQVGESASPSSGFGPSGIFQLVTKDIPAGENVLVLNSAVTGSYTPFASLYAPSSASAPISIQKRTVTLSLLHPVNTPKVGDPIFLSAGVSAPQRPQADVSPTGNLHLTLTPGRVIDAPVSIFNFADGSSAASASFTVTLPAGNRPVSVLYDGDSVYQPGSASSAVVVDKGVVGFSLIPGKIIYTVGEQITLTGRIQHPKVIGATPTGQITRLAGAAQFQGAVLGGDPQNSGVINVNLPVTGFPAAGNLPVTMSYGGDTNFVSATAGIILTIAKALPQLSLIPPAQITAGLEATFVVRASPPAGLASPLPITGQVTLAGVPNSASASFVASFGSSVATIRQTFPTAGTFTISVQYGGDANYLTATSASAQVVVR